MTLSNKLRDIGRYFAALGSMDKAATVRGAADALEARWQPITTWRAEVHGTRVLTPRGVAYWHEERWLPGRWNLEGDAEAFSFGGPTHFMVLPDPPVSSPSHEISASPTLLAPGYTSHDAHGYQHEMGPCICAECATLRAHEISEGAK